MTMSASDMDLIPQQNVTCDEDYALSNMTDFQRILKSVLYASVGTVAVFGNVLVIYMVVLSRKLHTITNIFIVNLSVADLLIGVMFTLQSIWILHQDRSLQSHWTCTVVGSVIIIAIGCSVSTLAFVAFNRLVLITRSPVTYRKVFTPCNSGIMVASTWLNLTGFIIVPQLIGYGQLGYDPYLEVCAWDPTHEHDQIYKGGILALLTLPLLASSFCYVFIFRYIRKHFKSLSSRRQSPSIIQGRRIDIIITKNLLTIICTFYVCIMPFVFVFCATGFVGDPERYGQVASYLAILLGMNSALNPAFCCLKHPHFREVFGHIIHCQFSRIPLPTRILRRALPLPNHGKAVPDVSSLNTRTETNLP